MKKYILKDDAGYITEKDGMYTHHFKSGESQSCSAKEILFHGGVEEQIIETAEIVYEPVEIQLDIEAEVAKQEKEEIKKADKQAKKEVKPVPKRKGFFSKK